MKINVLVVTGNLFRIFLLIDCQVIFFWHKKMLKRSFIPFPSSGAVTKQFYLKSTYNAHLNTSVPLGRSHQISMNFIAIHKVKRYTCS